MHIIISGTKGAGKTTVLKKVVELGKQWIAGGIICEEDRIKDINDGEMQFYTDEKDDSIRVGKYYISNKAVDFGRNALREGMRRPGWLVFDEIGPLELHQHGGFLDELIHAINRKSCIIIVRQGLLEQFQKRFPGHYKVFSISASEHDGVHHKILGLLDEKID